MTRVSDHARNRLAVLKAVRRHGPVARTQLPALCGLSSGLVSQLVAEQVERGLIHEQRETGGRPGRPRTLLQTSGGGAIVAVASISGLGEIVIVFVDLLGQALHQTVRRASLAASLPELADILAEAIDDAIETSPFPRSAIDRVGIILPALVSRESGSVHFMTMYPVDEPVPFAGPISQRLGLSVTLENEATAMARGQHWFGAALDLDTFTLVSVGYSISAAAYRDGLPWTGARGLNSEIGHVKVGDPEADARPCYCGGAGCLATHASMYGLLEHAGMLAGMPFPPIAGLGALFESFLDRAEAGEPGYAQALRRAGMLLGATLGNYVNIAGPGAVLVAFDSQRYLAAVEEPLRAAYDKALFPGMQEVSDLHTMVADRDWRWHGAAALALEQAYLGS